MFHTPCDHDGADEGADGTSGGGGANGGPCWDAARLSALRRESDMLASLRHPNVALFLGVVLAPPCVVTEYCAMGEQSGAVRGSLGSPNASLSCRRNKPNHSTPNKRPTMNQTQTHTSQQQ